MATSAGYGSLRRFNEEFRRAFEVPPSALRSAANTRRTDTANSKQAQVKQEGITLRLVLREPYRAQWVFPFLKVRAIRCLESVSANVYRRRLASGAYTSVEHEGVDYEGVEDKGNSRALRVAIPAEAIGETATVLARVRRLFDLTADPAAIDEHLVKQPQLAALVKAAPGIRVPGVWDAFEGVVRAVLGQQVSVARATVLAERLCERFGEGEGTFPSAATLASADVAAIGMPGGRGRAISEIARRVVAEGDGWLRDATTLRSTFAEIRGVGPWTTEYAAMRVSADADAFPDSDWGVWKVLGVKGKEARRWAEACRPWRAYATMHLWNSRSAP